MSSFVLAGIAYAEETSVTTISRSRVRDTVALITSKRTADSPILLGGNTVGDAAGDAEKQIKILGKEMEAKIKVIRLEYQDRIEVLQRVKKAAMEAKKKELKMKRDEEKENRPEVKNKAIRTPEKPPIKNQRELDRLKPIDDVIKIAPSTESVQ